MLYPIVMPNLSELKERVMKTIQPKGEL